MAYKFEDKFVHFRWSDELKGKKVFYADSISRLEADVAEGEDYKELCRKNGDKSCPFTIKGDRGTETYWQFVYYDPNYEVKLAYEQGKQIQYKTKNTGNWCDWNDSLCRCLFPDNIELRIKPAEFSVVLHGTELLWTNRPVENKYVYFKGTVKDCDEYVFKHAKFAPVMKAWEEGKDIEFCKPADKVWCPATSPTWDEDLEYRIKPEHTCNNCKKSGCPFFGEGKNYSHCLIWADKDDNTEESSLKWTDLRVGDVIESVSSEEGNMKAMVTAIDYSEDDSLHVFAGNYWHDDEELKSWRKVNVDE